MAIAHKMIISANSIFLTYVHFKFDFINIISIENQYMLCYVSCVVSFIL